METRLKPCPFCGNEVVQMQELKFSLGAAVYCPDCEILFTIDNKSATEEETIDAWNRRANDG